MTDESTATNGHDPELEEATAEDETLSSLRAETATLKDQALRFAAEAENTRRRAEKDVNDARAYAIQKFARDLLGVADNLSRALEHAPKDGDDPLARNLAVGLEMTQKELLSAFERNGLKRLAPDPGERFDPHLHQAVMEQASASIPPGGVISVLQIGYELFGRIVRPAMVIVASKDSTGPSAQESASGAATDRGDDLTDTQV
jgi:molecular chaperone GrpE